MEYNKQELQSFLGTVNFMSTFIPNLAKKTNLMRSLLKKDVHFVWTSDMAQEFENIKQAIASNVKLIHFDPNRETEIETDASIKGLGAVLIQDGRPVRFLSKSLTTTEADYSNIERELLAVLFACEKLHIYVFGRRVTIKTDHKPLESIFLKPISLAPARLQRMLLRLRMYDLYLKYVGAKSVLLADTLSRLVKPESDAAVPNLDVTIAQVLKIKPTHMESLQSETKLDPTLVQLRTHIIVGWPDSMSDIQEALRPFWCFRDELAILDGLVMKGNRVVVPSALREETLNLLHEGHQGLTATLQRARRTVYWPKLQDDISQMIQQCEDCQKHAKKKPRPPERQLSATRPMEIIGMDLLDFKGQHAVVAIDYFSGYVMLDYIRTETSESVMRVLNNNFRKFGLPESIISDNGPCFKSEKFAQFCNEFEVKHITSSPHYHQSNGRAERAIQTVKQIMKKSKTEGEVTRALLAYHDTPVSGDLPSPAELFFNRRINTRLGFMYQPALLTDAQKTALCEKRAAHLKSSKPLKDEFTPDQAIWFTEDGSPEWKPGYIECRDPLPDSYWIVNSENSRRLRRNKHDIKPRVPRVMERLQEPPGRPAVRTHQMPESMSPKDIFPCPNDELARYAAAEIPIDGPAYTDDTTPLKTSRVPEEAGATPMKTGRLPEDAGPVPPIRRSSRQSKMNRDPDFVYT